MVVAIALDAQIWVASRLLATPPGGLAHPTLGQVCNFRNEGLNLYEWMSHGYCQGVREFLMLDDSSTDNSLDEIERFRQDHASDRTLTVTVVARSEEPELAGAHHTQTDNYNTLIKRMRSDWVAVWDIDEFIFARGRSKTITAFLATVPRDIGSIYVHCKLFGCNNLSAHPPSLIHGNTWRQRTLVGKTLHRRSMIVKVGVHKAEWDILGRVVNADLSPFCLDVLRLGSCPRVPPVPPLQNMRLMCNHYQLQSREFWQKNKVVPGTLNLQWGVPTWDDFDGRDAERHDLIDLELSRLTNVSKCMPQRWRGRGRA